VWEEACGFVFFGEGVYLEWLGDGGVWGFESEEGVVSCFFGGYELFYG